MWLVAQLKSGGFLGEKYNQRDGSFGYYNQRDGSFGYHLLNIKAPHPSTNPKPSLCNQNFQFLILVLLNLRLGEAYFRRIGGDGQCVDAIAFAANVVVVCNVVVHDNAAHTFFDTR